MDGADLTRAVAHYRELAPRYDQFITNFEGFEAPWSLLATYLDDFAVRTGPLTQHYVATGRVR